MDRRRFLALLGSLALPAVLRPAFAIGSDDAACAAVEHAGSLDEVLFVYDQAAAPHLLREIVTILRHAPPTATVHVLVSRARAAEAGRTLRRFGLESFLLLPSDEEHVSGDWGRDILQLGCGRGGERLVCVPWNKTATAREELARGFRQLRGLARPGLDVRLLPVAAEGGNLHVAVRDGRPVLYAGSTIAVETRALYRAFYGTDPGADGVADVLRDGLGVDEVVWLGRREGGEPERQSPLVYHIDLGCAIVAPAVAVVARCDPARLPAERHREILREEAARTAAALARRGVTADTWPDGLDLPAAPADRDAYLDERLAWERAALEAAADELEGMAAALAADGHAVHRLEAAPERVRRFQSHTNVVACRDRLLVPLYPDRERVHGWVIRGSRGRDAVDVELGIADSGFRLAGDNLAAFRLYDRLHPGVRTVRDYFYLAGGNVHCVIGRLS